MVFVSCTVVTAGTTPSAVWETIGAGPEEEKAGAGAAGAAGIAVMLIAVAVDVSST